MCGTAWGQPMMPRTAIFALTLALATLFAANPTADQTRPTNHAPLVDMAQVKCLAEVVYHEARGESLRAQRGVAAVVMARAKATGQPPCTVAARPKQFSGVGRPMREAAAAELAGEIAFAVYTGAEAPFQATHFHDASVRPGWAKKMVRVARVGKLLFYA